MRAPMQAGDLSSRAALRRLQPAPSGDQPAPVQPPTTSQPPTTTQPPPTQPPPTQPPPSGPPSPPPMADTQQQSVSSFLQPDSYPVGNYGYMPGQKERFERATGMKWGENPGIMQYSNTFMRKNYFDRTD